MFIRDESCSRTLEVSRTEGDIVNGVDASQTSRVPILGSISRESSRKGIGMSSMEGIWVRKSSMSMSDRS